jgi:hypothetical protein
LLSLALVVVMVLASGVTSYAAYAAHDEHVKFGHIVGHQIDHDHHHGGAFSQTYVLLCDVHASCEDDHGDARGHVHICFEAPALTQGEGKLAFPSLAKDELSAYASSPLLDNPSSPLLRPPRATL